MSATGSDSGAEPGDGAGAGDAAPAAGAAGEIAGRAESVLESDGQDLTERIDRSALRDRLARALLRAGGTGCTVGLLIVDLDRFVAVNDALGYEAGDDVLREIARRLEHCLGPADTAARIGGDEFALIAEDLAADTAAVPIVERVLGALTPPTLLEGYDVSLTGSVGVATSDGVARGDSAAAQDAARQLVRDADMAMHWAKRDGGHTFRFHDTTMNETAHHRIAVETGLRRALADERIEVYYQPQLRSADQRLVGVEALVRWRDSEGNLHVPHEFLAVAEDTGLILPISQVVLEQACRQVRTWVRYTGRSLTLSVNVSARWLFDQALIDTIRRVLHETSLPPQSLQLELTEQVLLTDTDRAARAIDAIREMGAGIVIDDFGTGYASLNYLRRLPIDAIKIDRSFIRDLPDARADRAIVEAVIHLARELEIGVIAEGIETAAQAHFLTQAGCHRLQGYHFCMPRSGPLQEGYILDKALSAAQSPEEDD